MKHLWVAYNNKNSTFNDLLEKDGSVSIRHQIIQKPQLKYLKFLEILSPKIIDKERK